MKSFHFFNSNNDNMSKKSLGYACFGIRCSVMMFGGMCMSSGLACLQTPLGK